MIRENLEAVRRNIAAACAAAGRSPEEVLLLAVSKTKPVSMIEEAMAAGQKEFGENYVQEITGKYELVPDAVWHMIGHLQTNKVKYIIDRVKLIHSVDSIRLAEQIEKEAAKHGLVVSVLLEVNIAAEESKWGFSEEGAADAVREISGYPHVRVTGLMTSAPYTENPETNRVHFKRLKALSDRINALELPGVKLTELSMGMTGDYTVAVEEGATIVRVGTGIFGERDYS